MKHERRWSLVVYAPPTGEVRSLAVAPRLESWDASTHPAQIALAQYLDHVEEILKFGQDEKGLAIELVIGSSYETALAVGDLDNYLYPIVRRLGPARFLSAWARKRMGAGSTICIGQAEISRPPEGDWRFAYARMRASASTAAWKEELAAQLEQQIANEPSDAGVELHVCFRVGPHRNWAALWKPAIDSLGCLLGEGARRFHPRDDRIVTLALHRVIDPTIGHVIELGVWWRVPA